MKFFLILLFIFKFVKSDDNYAPLERSRNPKLFFYIPQPANSNQGSPCLSKLYNGYSGVCTDYYSCIATGGKLVGTCSFGLKACCLIDEVTTTTTTAAPVPATQTFENDFPVADQRYIINRISDDYCQVRLDFVVFNLEQPTSEGICKDGKLSVLPTSNGVPLLCGTLSGQHIYLELSGSSLNVDIYTKSQNSRWKIDATQIPCSEVAPMNCLQYYPDQSGIVRSFNFPTLISPSSDITYQLSNTDYDICVGSPSEYCGVEWTRDDEVNDYHFTLSFDIGKVAVPGDPKFAEAGEFCTGDFVFIEDGSLVYYNGTEGDQDTFCGAAFFDQVQSNTVSPARLGVFSNDVEETEKDFGNAGFSLRYSLTPCK